MSELFNGVCEPAHKKENILAIIMWLLNLLLKAPGVHTFYLWLRFTVYGRKPPEKYVPAGIPRINISHNKAALVFPNNRVEIVGNSNELQFCVNTTKWPTVFNDAFSQIRPTSIDDSTVSFEGFTFKTSRHQITIKDRVHIQLSHTKTWTRLTIAHDLDFQYGFGEKNGPLDKSGEKWIFWNIDNSSFATHHDPLYKSYPLLIITDKKSWIAIALDYPGFQKWNLKKSKSIKIDIESRDFRLHICSHSDPKSLSKSITRLLGQMELPPLWALGYHQSRWSYHPKSEVLRIAATLREKNIPCDAIYLDIDYMDEYKCFTWDKDNFGNLPELIRELHQMGFKVVLIIDPGIKVDKSYEVYTEAKDKGYFCQLENNEYQAKVWPGLCAFPDFFREDVRNWWKTNYQEFTDLGVDGFFNDMNEVSTFNLRGTMPDNVKHLIDGDKIDHHNVHNMYGQMMAKASYEGLKSLHHPIRPFLLTRSAYLGSQKYGFVWTGDNKSDWNHLMQSIPKLLNSGLAGHFANGADVGGFRNNTNPELFTRWIQLSVFYPFCRNHTAISTTNQEPWEFGQKIEDICRKFISLRYQLLPYLYTWFQHAALTGVPLLRPLWMEYPEKDKCYDKTWSSTQFFFGPHILVAPVLTPKSTKRRLYLPDGIWHNFFTNKKHIGGKVITQTVSLDAMPVYVKEGAIIPTYQKPGINTAETAKGEIDFLTFGVPQEGYLYQDDGMTNKYQDGDSKLMKITPDLKMVPIDELP